MSQQPRLIVPVPPQKAFAFDPNALTQENIDSKNLLSLPKSQNEQLNIIEKIVGAGVEYRWDPKIDDYKEIGPVDYAPKTGWFIYHKGKEFPQPGFVYPQALRACEAPKRHFLHWIRTIISKDMILPILGFLVLPKKVKGRLIDAFLQRYCEFADAYLMTHYLAPQYYHRTITELRGFLIVFLTELGVSINTANRFAFAFTTLIEYDSAYRVRVIDLFSETTKEAMMKNPVREINKLVKIFGERDGRKHLVEKFRLFSLPFTYGFWFIRKAFRNALETVEFSNLQYNDIDRHFVKHWTTYEFFGKTIEERLEMFPKENNPQFKLK